MARALHLGGDQEHSMEVGDSRSQEPTLSPGRMVPCNTAHHQGKRDARISRHMRGAVPIAPRSPSQITWPKIKNPGRGRVTARLHRLSQLRRQATKNYLLNFKITTIHTSVWFIVHDADRKTSKRSKVPQKKNLTRKERGKRKGSRKADRCGVTQEQVQ